MTGYDEDGIDGPFDRAMGRAMKEDAKAKGGNIIEGIQAQCRRVREELLPAYTEIGPAGAFGTIMLKQAIEEGEAAIASGDVVRMVRAYKDLEGCQ